MIDLTEIKEKFSDLTREIENLAQLISQAAEKLIERRILPEEKVDYALHATREKFSDMRNLIFDLAKNLKIDIQDQEDNSLNYLSTVLELIEKKYNERDNFENSKNAALNILRKAEAIVYKNGDEFKHLFDFKNSVQKLYQSLSEITWPDSDPTLERLCQGNHPIAMLVRLVEEVKSLSAEDCESLFKGISDVYDSKLGIEAFRGNLVISASQEPSLDPIQHQDIHDDTVHSDEDRIPEESLGNGEKSELDMENDSGNFQQNRIDSENILSVLSEKESDESQNVTLSTSTAEPEIELKEIELEDRIPEKDDKNDLLSSQQERIDIEETLSVLPEKESDEDTQNIALSTFTSECVEPEIELSKEKEPEFDILQPVADFAKCSSDLAKKIDDFPVEQHPLAIRELIWHLIHEEHLSLAYHLSLFLENQHAKLRPRIPSWAMRLMILGPHVRYAGGLLATSLRNDFNQYSTECYTEDNHSWNHAVRLILAGGSMRPALIAPTIRASHVLRDLKLKGLEKLYNLCKEIAMFGDQGQPLNPMALAKVMDETAWNEELDNLQTEVNEWSSQAIQSKFSYAAATKVWQLLLKPSGCIYDITEIIKKNDVNAIEKAKNIANELSSEQSIDKLVGEINKKRLGRQKRIQSSESLKRLRSKFHEIIYFLSRWVELQDSRPGHSGDYFKRQTDLRTRILDNREAVFSELDTFLKKHDELCIQAAGKICRRALEDVISLFELQDLPSSESELKYLLNSGLLLIPSVPLNDGWEPEKGYNNGLIRSILDFVAEGNYSWPYAFDLYCDQRDHNGTQRILDFLEYQKQTDPDIQLLADKREENLEECRKALERDLKKTEDEVDNAVALGLIGEEDRLKFDGRVRSVEGRLDDILQFSPEHESLEKEVREKINQKRQSEVDAVRQRLKNELSPEHPAFDRIERILDSGDIHTAIEYLLIALKGEPLPETSESRDTFIEFFNEKFKDIEGFLEPEWQKDIPNWPDIVRKLRRHASHKDTFSFGPIDMKYIRGNQAREAADLLESWFTLKRLKTLQETEPLKKLLESIGFSDVSLEISKEGKNIWADAKVRPISDRKVCPVTIYGSAAYGTYRLLCLWSRPSEDDLLSEVGDTSIKHPVIVLHFGRLTEKRRRSLAFLCRENRRTFLIIDDVLILYLCGEQRSRLATMFACTLPFTALPRFYGTKRRPV